MAGKSLGKTCSNTRYYNKVYVCVCIRYRALQTVTGKHFVPFSSAVFLFIMVILKICVPSRASVAITARTWN